jgi:Bifunctional DNA primase/polymerase, N-terminal/AAA domain
VVPFNELERLIAFAASQRLALFPIPAWRKRPQGIVRSHAEDWSRDPAQWRRWHVENQGCNFGVEAGASGKIFVDCDTDSNGQPYLQDYYDWDPGANLSAWVATPSGGRHFWFEAGREQDWRQPDIVKGRVNVRAGRGYVLAPGCQTRSAYDDQACDGSYLAGPTFGAIPCATAKLLAHCKPRADGPPPPSSAGELDADGLPRDAIARIEAVAREAGVLERLRGAVPGERNQRLNEAAFALGRLIARGLLDIGRAETELRAEGEALGLPRDEVRATVRSGLRAGPTSDAPEPKRALAALLAAAVPIQPRPQIPAQPVASCGVPEPIVERLLYEGAITTLSGGSGSGKTTLAASLVAASCADIRDFKLPGFESNASDVLMRPAAWVFVSYEGGQHIARTTAAWHRGTGLPAVKQDRCEMYWTRRGPLVRSMGREVAVDDVQATELGQRIDALRALGLSVVVVIDNVSVAVENPTDNVQASVFMRAMRALADQGVSVLLLAHPPKGRSSVVYGSHLFFSLADVVADVSVVGRNEHGWTQWVNFEKHRDAPNGECLELRSRRLDKPIIELPPGWGAGNLRARDRQIRDLHTPYLYSIRVRPETERDAAASGVNRISEISPKQARDIRIFRRPEDDK